MNITVIGSGYVGTTAAALFATAGHNVTALDIDKHKVETLNSGKAPFFEAGLDKLVASSIKHGKLIATTDYKQAITEADVVFSCVGTPDMPDGSSDLSFVVDAAESSAKHLKNSAIYVQKSTVPVGTGRTIEKLLPKSVAYVSNPEFLRESTAISDSLLLDRVVIGGDNQAANKTISQLHKSVEKSATKIAKTAGLDIAKQLAHHNVQHVLGQLESAELIKVTANAFLALKISFANSIAKLCDEVNADVTEVMQAVGLDKRIGTAFLNAGRGFGGGCFPKDVSGLISSGLENGVDLAIMSAAMETNQSMPGHIINKLEERVGKLEDKTIAVLGLAFKPGTSDTRRSPAIAITNILAKNGSIVSAYDPKANQEAENELNRSVKLAKSLRDALRHAEVICVATNWPKFTLDAIIELAPNAKVFVDAMNSYEKAKVSAAGFTYIGVGR